jgi:hypothetical protein
MTDHPMAGGQFKRWAGIDPARWAEGFLASYTNADGINTPADRQAFVADWFRSAMKAAAAKAEDAWMEVAKRRDQDVAGG